MTSGGESHVDLRQLLQGGSAPLGQGGAGTCQPMRCGRRATQGGVRIMNEMPGDELAAVASIVGPPKPV